MEEVLRGQPDVILDLSFAGRGGVEVWNAAEVPAVKHGRVVALTDPALTAPSPRIQHALQLVATAIAEKP
jgi:ABC-type Fe3+-hydroxamate transport system substrate-binding protein